jgi:hypothetical protein
MRIEYKKMALPGDIIIPHGGNGENGSLIITLKAKDGAVYTVMEFTSTPD